MPRRPAITGKRLDALAALANVARPRLHARRGGLFAFGTTQDREAVKHAVEFIDALQAHAKAARTTTAAVVEFNTPDAQRDRQPGN